MTALLELDGVTRRYANGEQVVHALDRVTLSIEAGEMVAIMGASGSGKSTLMNILGCLDRPDAGEYRVAGEPTRTMTPDRLARLRREHFGFIFQRYQLLDDLSAVHNVEIPAIYAGTRAEARHRRARALLERLGLGERTDHRPSQLSGGQQQRVSIARALMNGGEVILADEPTGALDSKSGEEVLALLGELNVRGHTIVLVTHDAAVAAHAHRIIELRDGRVAADRATGPRHEAAPVWSVQAPVSEDAHDVIERARSRSVVALADAGGVEARGRPDDEYQRAHDATRRRADDGQEGDSSGTAPVGTTAGDATSRHAIASAGTAQAGASAIRAGSIDAPDTALELGATRGWTAHVVEAALMAVRHMTARRMRTALTMLGIVVGIASVVCVTAYGEGTRREVLAQIRTLGTNVIEVMPGRGFGDQRANTLKPLTVGDLHALEQLDYVDAVSPGVSTQLSIRRGNVERTTFVRGIGAAQFRVRGFAMAEGQPFDERAIRLQAQEAIIDENVRKTFFGDVPSPLGQVLLVGNVPVRVVGVVRRPKSPFLANDSLNVYLPYTTAMARLTGLSSLQNITLRVRDDVPADVAEAGIKRVMTQRHGFVDFFTTNTEAWREQVNKTQATLTLLLASIALISLVVGGVGVMNIMLVTVTERTQEIGVRMAVGARRVDILRQFLIEAVLVCLIGGAVGVALALGIAGTYDYLAGASKMPVSGMAIAIAFVTSSAIGIAFGYAPARNASRLDPITALAGP